MIKILANDGIDAAGLKIFTDAGFEVVTEKVSQENLAEGLRGFDAILVRSATQVRKQHIDACENLKLIGRAGVGMDNIDVAYAREKGLHVVNTPDASSESVAELVFAHMFAMARRLYDSNRLMPDCDTKEKFNDLKKRYSAGTELKGKTIGIVGFGKIGQAVARIALGLGMKVMPFKLHAADVRIEIDFFQTHSNASMSVNMKCVSFEELLRDSDFITLHVPFPKGAASVLSAKEMALMKDGVCIINTSRGGAVDETDLLASLNTGKVGHAALDVFEGEPLIREELRKHPNVSLSPHIGGSTREAQERIGVELANKVVSLFKDL
jgi:D-3-phosphoglycerate dehydrogenase / 2-oxoglutarate reductase